MKVLNCVGYITINYGYTDLQKLKSILVQLIIDLQPLSIGCFIHYVFLRYVVCKCLYPCIITWITFDLLGLFRKSHDGSCNGRLGHVAISFSSGRPL